VYVQIESSCDSNKTTSTVVPSDGLLTDLLGCENSMENNEFVELFTSQLSSSYSNGVHSQSECCHSYNGNNSEGSVLSQTEIKSIAMQLVNLLKDLYIVKLLEFCADEGTISWYRNILCSWVKCLPDNLLGRKSTK
jgi:hypothetical protein